MTIGAVIVTHNSKNHIRSCLESLTHEGIQNSIVVDSASTDNTLQVLRELSIPCIPLAINNGFGHAANRGSSLMNTDYVLFMNPDARLETGALQSIRCLLHRIKKVGVIGLALEDTINVREKENFGSEPSLKRLFVRKLIKKQLAQAPIPVDWVSGGAMVVDRSLFSHLGGFDESFFLYWEDVDLCKRVREAEYTVWIDPGAKAIHIRGGSQVNQKTKTHIYDASADRYYKKHYSTSIWFIQHMLRKIYRIVRPETR